MNSTPVSLLEQLRNLGDRTAWQRFVEIYTPLLFRWSRRLGLQDSDAADLVQDVLVQLVQKLPEFHYDRQRSFRAWLWTVTLNVWRAKQRGHQPLRTASEAELAQLADGDPADAASRAEYQQYLAARALQVMKAEFKPATWWACWQLVVEGRSAAEIAAEQGVTVGAVYVAKTRVLRRVREVLRELSE